MRSTIVRIKSALGDIPAIRYDQNTTNGTNMPLVLFLHGRGEYGDGSDNGLKVLLNSGNHSGILRAADERKNFLVLAPQFVQAYNYDIIGNKIVQTWKPDFTGGRYVDDVVNWALKNMPIDPNRIYVTGLSSGGSGTWESILNKKEFTDKFAAAVPVCGGEQIGNYDLPVQSNVAVWAFHGANDSGKDGGTEPEGSIRSVKKLNDRNISPTAKITIYPGMGHGIWSTVYNTPELYDWLLSQTNDTTVPITTSTTTTSSTTVIMIKVELGRTWIPKLGKFIYIYDDGSTEIK